MKIYGQYLDIDWISKYRKKDVISWGMNKIQDKLDDKKNEVQIMNPIFSWRVR